MKILIFKDIKCVYKFIKMALKSIFITYNAKEVGKVVNKRYL
jgi:hypothetical protein